MKRSIFALGVVLFGSVAWGQPQLSPEPGDAGEAGRSRTIDWLQSHIQRGEKDEERYTEGRMGTFNRPTDVAIDAADGDMSSRFATEVNVEMPPPPPARDPP